MERPPFAIARRQGTRPMARTARVLVRLWLIFSVLWAACWLWHYGTTCWDFVMTRLYRGAFCPSGESGVAWTTVPVEEYFIRAAVVIGAPALLLVVGAALLWAVRGFTGDD